MTAVLNYTCPFLECTYCEGRIQSFITYDETYINDEGVEATRSITSTTEVDPAVMKTALDAHRATPCSSGTPNRDDATNITGYPTDSAGTTKKTEPTDEELRQTGRPAPGLNNEVATVFRIVTSDTTLTSADRIIAASGTGVDITLAPASEIPSGIIVTIKNNNVAFTGASVNVLRAGSDTIDAGTSITVKGGASLLFMSNGSDKYSVM